jgi:hypothetical protein
MTRLTCKGALDTMTMVYGNGEADTWTEGDKRYRVVQKEECV